MAGLVPPDFEAYFNVADELDGGLTLDDLDAGWVAAARRSADADGLPWPPYLPAAEEHALDLRARARRQAVD